MLCNLTHSILHHLLHPLPHPLPNPLYHNIMHPTNLYQYHPPFPPTTPYLHPQHLNLPKNRSLLKPLIFLHVSAEFYLQWSCFPLPVYHCLPLPTRSPLPNCVHLPLTLLCWNLENYSVPIIMFVSCFPLPHCVHLPLPQQWRNFENCSALLCLFVSWSPLPNSIHLPIPHQWWNLGKFSVPFRLFVSWLPIPTIMSVVRIFVSCKGKKHRSHKILLHFKSQLHGK